MVLTAKLDFDLKRVICQLWFRHDAPGCECTLAVDVTVGSGGVRGHREQIHPTVRIVAHQDQLRVLSRQTDRQTQEIREI